jgi:hypothetical protein
MAKGDFYKKRIFTPEFLWKLHRFHHADSALQALKWISLYWGTMPSEDAEKELETLRGCLMELAEGNEYPYDYAGDRTFAKDVDDIIEECRKGFLSLQSAA